MTVSLPSDIIQRLSTQSEIFDALSPAYESTQDLRSLSSHTLDLIPGFVLAPQSHARSSLLQTHFIEAYKVHPSPRVLRRVQQSLLTFLYSTSTQSQPIVNMENTDVAPSFTIAVTDFVMPDVVANPANAVALPLFAALALLITYLPLRSFYRVKNIAACSMMVVIIIINLMVLINGIIWPSDDWTKWWIGYGLCDVEVVLRFPITMALATSLCCLTKGLADALDTEHAVFNPSKAQRRRKVVGDVLFCWGVPVMMMALHYVVQAGRYMIIPVWGCADQLDNSWPMLVIIIMWCPIFTVLNVYYAGKLLFPFSDLGFFRKTSLKHHSFEEVDLLIYHSTDVLPPLPPPQDHLRRPHINRIRPRSSQIHQASPHIRHPNHRLPPYPIPLRLLCHPNQIRSLLLVTSPQPCNMVTYPLRPHRHAAKSAMGRLGRCRFEFVHVLVLRLQ